MPSGLGHTGSSRLLKHTGSWFKQSATKRPRGFGDDDGLGNGAGDESAISLSFGAAYHPVDLSLSSLGTSLVLLSAADAAAGLGGGSRSSEAQKPEAGVLLDISLVRGVRTLAVKSTVEVLNLTAAHVELRAAGEVGCLASGCKGSLDGPPLPIRQGDTVPLPLALTVRGSEIACASLELRPIPRGVSGLELDDVENGPRVKYGWGALARNKTGDAAVLTCQQDPGGDDGEPSTWTCCVSLEYGGVGGGGGGGSGGGSGSVRDKDLQRFELPGSEYLLGSWPCVLAEGVPSPCYLYLTPGYLCYNASMRGLAVPVRWDSVAQLHAKGHHAIEVVLDSGKSITFSGFLRERDETFRRLAEARSLARQQFASGLADWRPRRVVLRPPLVLQNLLPCAIVVDLCQQSREAAPRLGDALRSKALAASGTVRGTVAAAVEAHERARLLPERATRPRPAGIRPKTPAFDSIASHDVPSLASIASMNPAQTTSLRLGSGEAHSLHSVHLLQPLLLSVSLGEQEGFGAADGYRDPFPAAPDRRRRLHGSLLLQRPANDAVETEIAIVLRPVDPEASADPPARALRLSLKLRSDAAGSCSVALTAAHWMLNHASVDVALFDGRQTLLASASAGSATTPADGHMFALPEHRDDRGGLCTLSAAAAGGAAAPPPWILRGASAGVSAALHGVPPLLKTASRLSDAGGGAAHTQTPPFPIKAVGHQCELSLNCADGSVAPLVLSIEAARGPLAGAGATVVVVCDWCVLRNQTGIDLEWAQAEEGAPAPDHAAVCVPLPTEGAPVPLRWNSRSSEAGSSPLVCVRPAGGSHSWCAPFLPDADAVLKLRPAEGAADSQTLHLQMTITVGERGVRVALLRPAARLPYSLRNDTSLLLAFRQHGSSAAAWEVLGAGESCAYTWDDPRGRRQSLQLHLQDDGGAWHFTAPAGYALSAVGGCPDQRLEPQRAEPSIIGSRLRPRQETVLLTAGCVLLGTPGIGGRRVRLGWLCLTSRRIGFVPLHAPESGEASLPKRRMARQLTRSALTASPRYRSPRLDSARLGSPRLETLAELSGGAASAASAAEPSGPGLPAPIPLERVRDVRVGSSPGEMVLEAVGDKPAGSDCAEAADAGPPRLLVRFARLRERSRTIERVRAVLDGWQQSEETGEALDATAAVDEEEELLPEASKKVNLSAAWRADRARRKAAGRGASPASMRVQAKLQTHATRVQAAYRGHQARQETGWRAVQASASRGGLQLRRAQQGLQESSSSATPPRRFVNTSLGLFGERSSGSKRGEERGGTSSTPRGGANSTPRGAGVRGLPIASRVELMRSMRPATALMAAELIQAAQQGERIRARSLLAMRASPDAVDDKGFSALHYAAATGRTILVQTLLRAGADVEKPTQDELHSRPLHLAATCASAAASRATVRELLGAGADPTARRADGLTATDRKSVV